MANKFPEFSPIMNLRGNEQQYCFLDNLKRPHKKFGMTSFYFFNDFF